MNDSALRATRHHNKSKDPKMPRKKKPTPHTSKRINVELENGWTAVTRKCDGQLGRPAVTPRTAHAIGHGAEQQAHKGRPNSHDFFHDSPHPSKEQTMEQIRSLEHVHESDVQECLAAFSKLGAKWNTLAYRTTLLSALDSWWSTSSEALPPVASAVCVAIGAFNKSGIWRTRSMWQLLLLLEITRSLEAKRPRPLSPAHGKVKLVFQDPRLGALDEAFLKRLDVGFDAEVMVVQHPEANDFIGVDSLFMNAYLEWPVLLYDVLRAGEQRCRDMLLYVGPSMAELVEHISGLSGLSWTTSCEDDDCTNRVRCARNREIGRLRVVKVGESFLEGSRWVQLEGDFDGDENALMGMGLHYWVR